MNIKKIIKSNKYHKRMKKLFKVQDILLNEYSNLEQAELDTRVEVLKAIRIVNKHCGELFNEWKEFEGVK